MSKFKAKLVGVTRNDGSTNGVPVFDTVEVVMNMLEDQTLYVMQILQMDKKFGMEHIAKQVYMKCFILDICGTL